MIESILVIGEDQTPAHSSEPFLTVSIKNSEAEEITGLLQGLEQHTL